MRSKQEVKDNKEKEIKQTTKSYEEREG
jgi:hypothetical protein